ncbi:hypothetical protein HVA01_13200 [Halovibrio variabilis]|uniref:2-deoxy-D-gluconate 3-dehydrogenase n=1 Tax=Halovibrio variabilis TaxID=31910 RepID=A0A511UM38_9GAMM|nr:hypothetical protein HVA01_13200 [Halovibrio variabilis]
MRLFSLQNQVAMVTGCNKGLGQGLALALAEAGADSTNPTLERRLALHIPQPGSPLRWR